MSSGRSIVHDCRDRVAHSDGVAPATMSLSATFVLPSTEAAPRARTAAGPFYGFTSKAVRLTSSLACKSNVWAVFPEEIPLAEEYSSDRDEYLGVARRDGQIR